MLSMLRSRKQAHPTKHQHTIMKEKQNSTALSFRPYFTNFIARTIREHAFDELVNLFRLLALSPSFSINDVNTTLFPNFRRRWYCSGLLSFCLVADHTDFLSMLQVVTMILCKAAVDCHFHPSNLIHKGVSPLLHLLDRPIVTCIDHPDEDKAFILHFVYRNICNMLVRQLMVANCNSSCRLRAGKLPWRIHHDHIKLHAAAKRLEIKRTHICSDGHRVFWAFPVLILEVTEVFKVPILRLCLHLHIVHLFFEILDDSREIDIVEFFEVCCTKVVHSY
mmetsp:Transcript_42218/g.108726  ORF Transcript_42218/g.108726 Transcript_42218/m.108726 type:complete len:278 (-) Transcript_42218:149-982(-)